MSTAGLRPRRAGIGAETAIGETGSAARVDASTVVAIVALLGSASVFYAAPWPALYMPAIAVTFGVALWRPVPSMALVPAFAPFFMEPKHIGHFEPAPQEVFLAIATLALATRTVIRPVLVPQWRRLQESPFAPPAALFVLAACISSVFAAEHHLAFRALYQVVLEPVLFFALLTLFVQRETEWWILVLCTIGSGLVVSCVGIGQLLTGHGVSLVPRSSVHRVKAFYGSPDNLGLLLDRVIPLWLAPLLFCFGRNGARVVWLLAGVPLIAALIYTFSRGAWFALAAVLLVYLVARGGRWTWVAAGILVLGLVGTGLKAHSAARLLQAGHAGTAQKRIDIWHSSLNMIRDHPIVGIGPDNFQHYYAPRPHQQLYSPDCPRGLGYLNDSSLTVSQEPCLSHPHDEFLDAWLSTGILGLVAFVWLQFAFWRLARSWSAAKETTRRVLLLGAAGAMLAGLLHGLVDNGYFLMDLSVLFWMVCALIQFCAESPRKRVAEP